MKSFEELDLGLEFVLTRNPFYRPEPKGPYTTIPKKENEPQVLKTESQMRMHESPPPICSTINSVIVLYYSSRFTGLWMTLGLSDVAHLRDRSFLLLSFYKETDCSRLTDAST